MKEIQFSALFSAFTPPSHFLQCNLSVSIVTVIRPTQIHVFVLPVRLSTHYSSIWKSWQCFGFINSRIMRCNRSLLVQLSFIELKVGEGSSGRKGGIFYFLMGGSLRSGWWRWYCSFIHTLLFFFIYSGNSERLSKRAWITIWFTFFISVLCSLASLPAQIFDS